MTIKTKLERCLNLVQWSYHPVQKYWNLVNWCKTVATTKVVQFVIAKHNVITPPTFVPYLKMAIRWIDAKQRTIAERVSASLTSGFPMVGVPCPDGALVSVGSNQSLTTIGAKPFLPLPSLLYCALSKSSHGRISKATRVTRRHGITTSARSGWSWEGDEWMKKVGKRVLVIYKRPPWGKVKRTMYYIWLSGHSPQIGEARTLVEAKRKADAYAKRMKLG